MRATRADLNLLPVRRRIISFSFPVLQAAEPKGLAVFEELLELVVRRHILTLVVFLLQPRLPALTVRNVSPRRAS
jgi:hypothetical protein